MELLKKSFKSGGVLRPPFALAPTQKQRTKLNSSQSSSARASARPERESTLVHSGSQSDTDMRLESTAAIPEDRIVETEMTSAGNEHKAVEAHDTAAQDRRKDRGQEQTQTAHHPPSDGSVSPSRRRGGSSSRLVARSDSLAHLKRVRASRGGCQSLFSSHWRG